jgi:hypothetical protein
MFALSIHTGLGFFDPGGLSTTAENLGKMQTHGTIAYTYTASTNDSDIGEVSHLQNHCTYSLHRDDRIDSSPGREGIHSKDGQACSGTRI